MMLFNLNQTKMKNRPFILAQSELERLKDLSLFYPCAGKDYHDAVKMFSPYITDFWFVDKNYFGYVSIDIGRGVLFRDRDYVLLNSKMEGNPFYRSRSGEIWPCILTETYRHLPSDRIIRIHLRKGYGFSTLRHEGRMDKLGVFFYRGDSAGEGGSGDHWLRETHLNEIYEHMVEGGLLAIDGSNGGGNSQRHKQMRGPYRELFKYFWGRRPMDKLSSKDLIEGTNDFTDKYKRKYSCIGYAGERYGPTMIWKVDRSAALQPEVKTYERSIRPYNRLDYDPHWLADEYLDFYSSYDPEYVLKWKREERYESMRNRRWGRIR